MTVSSYILETAKRIVALHSEDDETAHGSCNCDQCLIACALGTEASENAMLRAKVERLQAEIATAVRIFNTVRWHFQSYEECYEEENCAESHAHEPRREMDEFVERNRGGG